MPPPDPDDVVDPQTAQNATTSLNPTAQRFLDRHVRYPLGRPAWVRQADKARSEGRQLPTPSQLISRLAAVEAVHKQRAAEIPASRAKALAGDIAGARAALAARQWSTAALVIEQAEGIVQTLPPARKPLADHTPQAMATAAGTGTQPAPKTPPARPKTPPPPDPNVQKLLQERQAVTADTATRVNSVASSVRTTPLYDDATKKKMLADCEVDAQSDLAAVLAGLTEKFVDYDTRVDRLIQAKQVGAAYVNSHRDPKLGKLPARVVQRKQAWQKIMADADAELKSMAERDFAASSLAKELQAKVAQGVPVPFDSATELKKMLDHRTLPLSLSAETQAELKAAIDVINDAEQRRGYDALAKLSAHATDRDKAEVLNRHGCFKRTDGGTSDVRLLQNPDKSIAFAFKSVAGESNGGAAILGLGKGAQSMREDLSFVVCREIAEATKGKLDFGFPATSLVQLDGRTGALIEGIKGEMADPEELDAILGDPGYVKKFGQDKRDAKVAELRKAIAEVPEKVSEDSLQDVVLSSMMTCQWDCKWGNMIVEGTRARPIDGGTAFPSAGVFDLFMNGRNPGPPSLDTYVTYPKEHPKAGQPMSVAGKPLPADKVAAILALKPDAVAAKAKARRDELLRDYPEFDKSLLEDSSIDVVQASMEAAQKILKGNPNITLANFIKSYESWFVAYYNAHVKS